MQKHSAAPSTPCGPARPMCTCAGTAAMQVGHFRSQNVRVKRRFTPLEFIWVIMILRVVHMSGVLHMQPPHPGHS